MPSLKDIFALNGIIDPTLPSNAHWLPQIANYIALSEHYIPFSLKDDQNQTVQQVVLTHPIVSFNKPARKSKKTSQLKPAGSYYAVFDPDQLGAGAYGGVYTVCGVWANPNDSGWVYKLKPADRKRVLKTDVFMTKDPKENPDYIIKSYMDEQRIGFYAKHMGYDYIPFQHQDKSFLFMRWQPGETLNSLLPKLDKDPNYLSAQERLTITVHMMQALQTQVSSIVIPVEEKHEYLVHRDLSTNNILIDFQDFSARIIDYGLAVVHNQTRVLAGTPLYMDPQLLHEKKKRADKISDFYSLSRNIAELWGDKTYVGLEKVGQLKNRNLNNTLTGLLVGITGITPEVKTEIQSTIKSMCAYFEKDRPSPAEALNKMYLLLLAQILTETSELIRIMIKPIVQLSPDELMRILKSDMGSKYLESHSLDVEFIWVQLKHRLLDLDEPLLLQFSTLCRSFREPWLSIADIQSFELSASQLEKLVRVGCPVHSVVLYDWLFAVKEEGKELEWAKICRVLYKLTYKPDEVINKLPVDCSFKSLYCRYFLQDPTVTTDDKTIVRLIKWYLNLHKEQIADMHLLTARLNQHFLNTPLAARFLAAFKAYELQSSYNFYLSKDPIVSQLLRNLDYLISQREKIKVGSDLMTNRKHRIQELEQQFLQLGQMVEQDCDIVLAQIIQLSRAYTDFIEKFETNYQLLQTKLPEDVLKKLQSEIDSYYDIHHPNPEAFPLILEEIEAHHIQAMEKRKQAKTAQGFFPGIQPTRNNSQCDLNLNQLNQ